MVQSGLLYRIVLYSHSSGGWLGDGMGRPVVWGKGALTLSVGWMKGDSTDESGGRGEHA